MAKPDITAVAANFEKIVGEMHAVMQGQRKEMLAGVDLSAFKASVAHTGEEQVAARSVGDMSKDTTRTV